MNRKVIKVVSILLMVLMVVMTLSTSVFAADPYDIGQFDNKQDTSGAKTSIANMIGALISIIQVVGMGVAIIMLIVMAIKYISAAPSEKAEIKKSAMVYVVGAIVLFAASGILQIVKNFATNVSATGNDKQQTTSTSTTSCVEIVDMDEMYLG